MSSIVSTCIYITESNDRLKYAVKSLNSLLETVDFTRHKLHISDNNSCADAKQFIQSYIKTFSSNFPKENIKLTTLKHNYGTAVAQNFGIAWRDKNTVGVVKYDEDMLVHSSGWVDEMEEYVLRQPKIGLCTLKRVDFGESPSHENPSFRTELIMLPHERGQSWLVAEKTKGAMSNIQMMTTPLLDKINSMYQPSIYAWDDADMSIRTNLAGFAIVFIPHIRITHLDDGTNPYTQEKIQIATESAMQNKIIMDGYLSGVRPIYYEQDFSKIEFE